MEHTRIHNTRHSITLSALLLHVASLLYTIMDTVWFSTTIPYGVWNHSMITFTSIVFYGYFVHKKRIVYTQCIAVLSFFISVFFLIYHIEETVKTEPTFFTNHVLTFILYTSVYTIESSILFGGEIVLFFRRNHTNHMEQPHHDSYQMDSFLIQSEMNQTCSICLEEGTNERKNICELPCKHQFHLECVLPWIRDKNTCPNCRDSVF